MKWEAWGPAAFARARREGKPVLLALTAAWCHACHRMDEETWQDPGVAAAVERVAVPVLADADLRPDVYERYHLGGLPSTALLGADGAFVRGGTFLLPAQFLAFLDRALADLAAGRRPSPRLVPLRPPPAGGLAAAVAARLLARADPEHGGFGMAPKRPEVEALTLLLRRWRATGEPALAEVARRSLEAIRTHLEDAVEGGFFRYGAAADWSGPHTEKLATEQAALAHLFLEAALALGDPAHAAAGRRTLGFLRQRLADEGGRVWASIAADPDHYARRERGEDGPARDERRFADAAAAATSAAALAEALGAPAPGFAEEWRLRAGEGLVPHRLDGPSPVAGLLDDQARAVQAAVDRYRLGGAVDALAWAGRAAALTLDALWDESAGACRAGPISGGDGPLPAMVPMVANGRLALALAALGDHLAEGAGDRHRETARRMVDALAPRAAAAPAGAALALAAQYLEVARPRVDLAGAPGAPAARALVRAVVEAAGPTAVIRWTGGTRLAATICLDDRCLPPVSGPAEVGAALGSLGLARGLPTEGGPG